MPYYRKSAKVQAIQVTKNNIEEIENFIGDLGNVSAIHSKGAEPEVLGVNINTDSQTILAYNTDWVVIDEDNSLSIYEDEKFQKLFSNKTYSKLIHK